MALPTTLQGRPFGPQQLAQVQALLKRLEQRRSHPVAGGSPDPFAAGATASRAEFGFHRREHPPVGFGTAALLWSYNSPTERAVLERGEERVQLRQRQRRSMVRL